ncbi:MAG: hypothetical protein BGO19_02395 [Acinetobacter sp. 38-8]|nr:MAG: hypothetical protein BGO19_02395 [Acinetobacter sp. 38-8]
MYILRIFEVTENSIGGIEGYDEFEHGLIPEKGQWITLPNADADEEVTYRVLQVVIPLRSSCENIVEIYTVRIQENGQFDDALYSLLPSPFDK